MLKEFRDGELLERMSNDCAVSFDEIYRRYSKPLFIYFLNKLKDVELSNDALQDLFINFWERRSSLNIDKSLQAYLYQSARFKVIDIYRSNIRYKALMDELVNLVAQHYGDGSEMLDHKKRLQIVLNDIQHMPERMKQIFVSSRFEYLTVKEIAAKYKLSPQTVKNQLSKALQIIRLNHHWLLLLFYCLFT